jgi:hypothetical protein
VTNKKKMAHWHGKVLSLPLDDSHLPSASDLLQSSDVAEVTKHIRANEDLYFIGSDVEEYDTYPWSNDPSVFKISLWGRLDDGRKALVILNDIRLKFEIRCLYGDTTGKYTYEIVSNILTGNHIPFAPEYLYAVNGMKMTKILYLLHQNQMSKLGSSRHLIVTQPLMENGQMF